MQQVLAGPQLLNYESRRAELDAAGSLLAWAVDAEGRKSEDFD